MVCVCWDRYPGISRSRDVSIDLRCAGLRRSIEMLSVWLLGERSEPVLVNAMAILYVYMYVCMFICHQPTAVSVHASLRNAQM